jgi:hypothetical protein
MWKRNFSNLGYSLERRVVVLKDIIMLAYFKNIIDRLDVLETKVNTLETRVNTFEVKLNNKHRGLTAEQREILLAEGTVKEKAKRLGRSTGWVSKWVKCLDNL